MRALWYEALLRVVQDAVVFQASGEAVGQDACLEFDDGVLQCDGAQVADGESLVRALYTPVG